MKPVYTPVTVDGLTLDQWRPIPEKDFAKRLADGCSYDGETFVSPIIEHVELPLARAIVFLTCDGYQPDGNGGMECLMSPELMILEQGISGDIVRQTLCFVHN